MAKKVTVELVDDITGESGASTTQFSLDGIDYDIDLNPSNDQKLRAVLAPWITKSRRTVNSDGRGTVPSSTNGSCGRPDMHHIRVWAVANNMKVPARGKMPTAIIAAYDSR
ncbi:MULTISPECIES: Lsr2 family protein [Mycobacteroides]|uniref:histone-like nucleoid-structuring protein Lsr2 n=1 Tax=Mycobacteroides TaxID=670516 RepID=UPI0007141F9A|nr:MULTISPECIES: Lsr2 family protein [Mycobacteroides]KRQ23291.1 hypothetical protein AOT91_23025 [Mycobacteroides sp. H092]KRQ23460.1 hypothetical protein AOT87_12285 [Mycobacteroides sp. H003]KRQ40269.1 hypothetical protein AOT92_14915 [Mycobacteroides sp. H101]KRQ47418.1 hypothetical protein AOT88_16005 [Mycobacteroides sp. H063]KRQ57717.1 hypothetical protein AOT90_25675 [Mycobacteroides sp. H079]